MSQTLAEIRVCGTEGAENVIKHQRGLFRDERDRRASVGRHIVERTHWSWRGQPGCYAATLAIKFQSEAVVCLTGALAARGDQILYVAEAAILKHFRIVLLLLARVQNLTDICGHQSLRALAVNVQNYLAKVGGSKLGCSGIELRAHLLDRSCVAADDEHVLPDKHDHSSLTSCKGRE